MQGTSLSRRCAACDREVHDLSSRTELEATALLLVLGSSGLCVRYELDADGTMRHAAEPKRPRPEPRAAIGMMAAAAIGVAACSPSASAPSNVPSIALPPPAPLVAAAPEPEPPPADSSAVAVAAAVVDTDKDGIPDADDACPMEPGKQSAAPAKNGCPAFVGLITQGEVVVLQHVAFGQGARSIDARSQALLDEVAKLLQQHPDIVKIAVQGHASSDEQNATKLAKSRAEVVRSALTKLKVEPARLVVESYGLERPIADNATQAGRAKNRRVEFRVLEKLHDAQPAVAAP